MTEPLHLHELYDIFMHVGKQNPELCHRFTQVVVKRVEQIQEQEGRPTEYTFHFTDVRPEELNGVIDGVGLYYLKIYLLNADKTTHVCRTLFVINIKTNMVVDLTRNLPVLH